MKPSLLNTRKTSDVDGIPAWLLKENGNLVADPISDILNCCFSEAGLPPSWKLADNVPVPKRRPVTDANKDLRSISLTPA